MARLVRPVLQAQMVMTDLQVLTETTEQQVQPALQAQME